MSEDLLFVVEAAFAITGRGTVLAGELCEGSVAVGDHVIVTGPDGVAHTVRVAGIDRSRRQVERAAAGEGPVGLLVEGVSRDEVAAGTSVRAAGVAPSDTSASATAAAPPQWMADPTGRHESRYWDGGLWTAHVSDAGVVAEDPLAPTPPATPGAAPTDGSSEAPGAVPDLERMRELVSARLAQDGPAAFADLRLDVDPSLLPERVALLGVQLGRATRPGQVLDLVEERAAIYEALGMTVEADRDRLAWAAIKEGHSGLSRTSKEWARGLFGLEFGSTFTATYDLLTKREGERVRVPLMRAGRAVALGYCTGCGRVEQLDEHLRCRPRGHAKVEDVACVVPHDAAAVRAALEAAHEC